MAIYKNSYSLKVTPDMINNVFYTGSTITAQGADSTGGYYITYQHDVGGCGTLPESNLFVEIKDVIPWTKMTCEFYCTGTSACWDFNNGTTQRPPTIPIFGNMMQFDATQDKVFNCVNSFENPAYTLRMSACDNDATNFMRFNSFRSFYSTRRRNLNGQLAGPQHGRSCNTTGAGATTTIRNIYIIK